MTAVRRAWSGAETGYAADRAAASVRVLMRQDGSADLADLSSRVTLAALASRRGDVTLLHACGLAAADGSVAAFVGPSGRGKTTVAATLGRHFGYLSDETVAVAASGEVLAYRKPLSLVRAPDAAKEQVSPVDLGLLARPEAALQIASVILLDRSASAPPVPQLRRLSVIEALPLLVPNLSYLAEQPHGLRMLSELADRIGGFRSVRYRDAVDLLTITDQLFAPDPAAIESVTASYRHAAADSPGVHPGATGPVYVQRSGVQSLEGPAQTAALGQEVLHILGGIGPALWRALEIPATVAEISALVVAELNPPPTDDATDLVERALAGLVNAGLVTEQRRR